MTEKANRRPGLDKIVQHLLNADPKLRRDVAITRAKVLWHAPKVYAPGLGMVDNPHYLGGKR